MATDDFMKPDSENTGRTLRLSPNLLQLCADDPYWLGVSRVVARGKALMHFGLEILPGDEVVFNVTDVFVANLPDGTRSRFLEANNVLGVYERP